MPLNIQEPGCARTQRATQVPAVFLQHKRGFLHRVWIARVPDTVAEIVKTRSLQLVSARLRENFDPAKAEFVVFRRKRILIDPDFPDRFLARQLASAEAVNENLVSGGAGGWSCKRLEIGREILGVVGQRLEIVPSEHNR